jgi:phosphatidate cytidylyltransferase
VTVYGAVYVGFNLSHLVLIRALDSGTPFVLATLVSVWANDTLAYAVGALTGKHKMAPHLSPKKSWEGVVAGTIGSTAVWACVPLFGVPTSLPWWWFLVIGLSVSLASVLGDLAESRIKREAGVKDSGRFLPGHGGFLDRFDSMIMVSVVSFYLLVFGLLFVARAP